MSKDLIKKTKQKPPQSLDTGFGLSITCSADWQCQVNFVSLGQVAFKPKTWHLTRSTSSPVHTGMPPCPPDNPLTGMDYKSIDWESDLGRSDIRGVPAALTAPWRTGGSRGNTRGQECRWLCEAAAVCGPVPCVCRLLCRLSCSMATASPVSASMHSQLKLLDPSSTHGLLKTKDVHSPLQGKV